MSPRSETMTLMEPVQFVKGIGPKKALALEQIGIRTVHDLLYYVPRRYLDRTTIMTIAGLKQTTMSARSSCDVDVRQDVTVVGEVRSFRVIGFGRKARFVMVLADKTGSMQCVWFGGVQYWKNRFAIGEVLAVSGQPSYFGSVLQIIHPDVDRITFTGDEPLDLAGVDWGKTLNTGGLVPLYSSSQELARIGLDSSGFRRLLGSVVRSSLPIIKETLPAALLQKHRLTPLRDAIGEAHFPASLQALQEALRRLKYEELFLFQLKLALKRSAAHEGGGGIAFSVKSALARQLVDSLPFALTRAQVRVIKEISGDMASPDCMNRLLQGDVGSGKTIVALIAMLIAVENGYQAVFMAPTEILAEQHFHTIARLLDGIPVTHRLLVGAQKSALRRDVLQDIHRGSAQIILGTHALFEEDVEFARLGLIVIDEQHRFGVLQRAHLRAKGANPDVLVMTATPIPRTLSMTLYGDLDVSVIDELPRNRRPIKTLVRYEEQKEELYSFVREQITQGRQAYFVYPLIEESEKMDLKAATAHFEQLQSEVFPDLRLGLVHGRLPADEKDRVMTAFKDRSIDILVATTVIEVGIDVPNASVMVIENAERFGLSQLHQLRGRVGRGSDQSYCILLAKRWIARRAGKMTDLAAVRQSQDQQRLAEKRLATMAATTDGFKIAEVDLELRGPGDYFGTRQSGAPEFRVANIVTDGAILAAAHTDAFALIEHDPHLRLAEHRALADQVRTHFRSEIDLLRA
jgi:ATP-dependent DNA helicase RecG